MAKLRSIAALRRRPPDQWARHRVLLVCEGECTEPHYFQALRDRLQLNTLFIQGTPGLDPRRLVEVATNEARREKRHGDSFDSVYCVFDRDAHPKFQEASEVAQSRKIKLARSWPCFEYWLLLHFEFTRAPYVQEGKRSSCDACVRDLLKHLPGYSKGDPTSFDALWPRLGSATTNAKKARQDAENTGEMNPSTEVHVLATHLLEIAEDPSVGVREAFAPRGDEP